MDQRAEARSQLTEPRNVRNSIICASDFPLAEVERPSALATIVGVDGPSYRPVGATMVLSHDSQVIGSLSSGCIDADIALHAKEAACDGKARRVRYGAGSPFIDIRLPCGAGLDILVAPAPDGTALDRIKWAFAWRRPLDIWIGGDGVSAEPNCRSELRLSIRPDPRFLVFGKGPEAVAFSRMTAAATYDTILVSPDDETLFAVGDTKASTIALSGTAVLDNLAIDPWTAGVLFFHDHDYETEILQRLLWSEAFYVGAQGSRRTAARRIETLARLGMGPASLSRVHGPIGLVPSTRDARTLAVSVLAEVLAQATVLR